MTIENFNKFYDEYQRFSAYVAYCITKDKLLAEDISQEIFITLYKMRENLDYSDHRKRLPMNEETRKHSFCAWKKKLIRDLFFGNSE